ncbi:putative Glycosyltransferase family 92 [Helianthus annuus]|nr:putative Glycosyltransferase family 92 [Helianthus annuus]
MDSPEPRRKLKTFKLRDDVISEHRRKLKTVKLSPLRQFPTVRSVFYFFCFFLLFFIIFRRHPTTSFQRVVELSRFSKLSTYKFDSVRVLSKFNELTQFKIESRVSFPDHILLIGTTIDAAVRNSNQFECVYRSNFSNLDLGDDVIKGVNDSGDDVIKGMNVLSVDEYSDNRLLVRCALPPVNFSAPVGIRRRGLTGLTVGLADDKPLNTWENLAYEAVLDGNTAVVFVKGISHRQGKESDPRQFRCHFGLGEYMITSRAVTAAQEVVRCALPRSMVMRPEKTRGVRATVSFRMPRVHGRVNHVLVPSVAKIPGSVFSPEVKKHELCVCTMLWNQAHSIREWITYHSWLGVEKWFVYDNNSDDEIKTVIEDLDFEGYNVSRHVWPWIKTQEAGFSHCAIRAQSECNWVSFMDVDEFYYFPYNPVSGFPGQGSLRTLVSNFTTSSSIGEIRTSCHSFGPSGLTSRPKQGVTVGYTCRLQSPERHKSIIRPDALDTNLMNVVHHFHLRKGFTFIDLPQNTAIINHYKYQVWEVFRAKFYRRVATYVADWKDNQNEGSRDRAPGLGTEPIEPPDWRLQFCEVWDTGLRDFVLANLGDVTTGVLPWDRSM